MALGLWFGPTSAAQSSGMLTRHRDHRIATGGQRPEPRPIWETEASEELCLVSPYGDDFADELIRCARELGVVYFKWDAVGQHHPVCDEPGHGHGGPEHSAAERGASYRFQLPLTLTRIAERVAAAVPGAVIDFDVTEPARAVGLAFLSAGRYFLINNGPYAPNLDLPTDKDLHWDNPNLFFHPCAAQDWICRTPLDYDGWIPAHLFLVHYLPDDPAANQDMSAASAMLGHHGLWGDLLSISDEGRARLRTTLDAYRQVRDRAIAATLIRTSGVPGSMLESYERVHPESGHGVVAIFANGVGAPFGPGNPMVVEITTRERVRTPFTHNDSVRSVRLDAEGRAVITATFEQTGAATVVFGATPAR